MYEAWMIAIYQRLGEPSSSLSKRQGVLLRGTWCPKYDDHEQYNDVNANVACLLGVDNSETHRPRFCVEFLVRLLLQWDIRHDNRLVRRGAYGQRITEVGAVMPE